MRTRREIEGESEPCREMLQTRGGDTNWGVGSVSLRRYLMFLLSWIEVMFTRLWQMSGMFVLCVKLSLFSCRGDALDVNKKDRMEEIRMVRRKSKSCGGILSILLLCFEI